MTPTPCVFITYAWNRLSCADCYLSELRAELRPQLTSAASCPTSSPTHPSSVDEHCSTQRAQLSAHRHPTIYPPNQTRGIGTRATRRMAWLLHNGGWQRCNQYDDACDDDNMCSSMPRPNLAEFIWPADPRPGARSLASVRGAHGTDLQRRTRR